MNPAAPTFLEEFYGRLEGKKLITKNNLELLVNEIITSSTTTTLDDGSLCDLVDDPKGDAMCQVWALVPFLNEKDPSLIDEEFVKTLSMCSKSVKKDANGKIEQQLGGGITGVAQFNTDWLDDFAKNKTSICNNREKKIGVPKILNAALRAALAQRLYAMLSTRNANVKTACEWKMNNLKKPTLALPFFASYELFLKMLEDLDIPVAINYLQYRAPRLSDDDDALRKNGAISRQPVLERVSVVYPRREPADSDKFVVVIDMYSAFYGDVTDVTINERFAAMEQQLRDFNSFSQFVLDIAAAHTQFVSSTMAYDDKGCPVAENFANNQTYLTYLERVRNNRVGIINIVSEVNKKRMTALTIMRDANTGDVMLNDIPLNTLHVYPVPKDELDGKTKYWRNWIGK